MYSLNDLLVQSVRKFPGQDALVDRTARVSYAELHAQVTRMAEELSHRGVGPGRRVGIALRRGQKQIVSILGVLYSGASYVPLDPSNPRGRTEYMIRDSGVEFLVSEASESGSPKECRVSAVDRPPEARKTGSRTVPQNEAYVIYTSGSTGWPKGCSVSHANVVSLLEGALPLYEVSENDRWSQFHSINFDFSVWEIWGALSTGASLCLVTEMTAATPRRFLDLVEKQRITILNQVPSVFRHMTEEVMESDRRYRLGSVRYVIFGGEPVDLSSVGSFRSSVDSSARFVNMYGITESTVHASFKLLEVEETSNRHTPLGRALRHLRITLRDGEGEEVGPGEHGEMYISGSGLSAGYVNRSELTAERFPVINGTRHYRTGDIAFQDTNGDLFFIGRNDNQFKHRGFRVEPGEVEAAIRSTDHVKDAAVTLARHSSGETCLIAFCVAGEMSPEPLRIRAELYGRIPGYMIPERIYFLDEMPMSGSGKLDRVRISEIASEKLGSSFGGRNEVRG